MERKRFLTPEGFALILVFIVFTFVLTSSFHARWPDATSLILGDNVGVVPVLVAMGTLVAIAISANNSIKALQQSRLAEAATRFQKGAEMLNSDNPAVKYAGFVLLRAVTKQFPLEYTLPVAKIFIHYVETSSERLIEVARSVTRQQDRPPTDPNIYAALTAIGELNDEANLLGIRQETDRTVVNRIYFCDSTVANIKFTNIDFTSGYISGTMFFNCSFFDTRLRFDSSPGVIFHRCEFYDTNINADGVHFQRRKENVHFSVTNVCRNSKINDIPIEEFSNLD